MSRRPPLPSLNSSIPKGMANSQGAAASSGPPSRRQQQSLNAILPSSSRLALASAPPSVAQPQRQRQEEILNPSLQRPVAAMAPVQPSSVAPSDLGAGVQGPPSSATAANILPQELFLSPPSSAELETDLMSQEAESAALRRQSRPLLSNFSSSGYGTFNSGPANSPSTASLLPGLSREQQARRGRRMGPPASADPQQVARVQMGAEALALMAEEALRQEQDSKKASSAASDSIVRRRLLRSPAPSTPPTLPIQPSTPRMFEESPSVMERASRIDYIPFEPTRQALFSSPPPSSADQSVLDRIRSLERELEECIKKVTSRESLLKNRGSKNIAQLEQIRVLEEQLQQARQAQEEQIRVLEQQLQQARQAQQALDDDATSSNASSASSSSASFKSVTSNPYNDDDAEGGKRKTKFKKNKKMYNKTSKKYNKTSKKYKNKKARY